MHIQLDPLGGIAGDMFIAAVLDARPELQVGMLAAIRATGMPQSAVVSTTSHRDHVFRGLRFIIDTPTGHDHDHHQSFLEIVGRLRNSPIDKAVCDAAVAIFEILAVAEADVHGVDRDDVTFHEVGAWDSIGDIVGAAYLIDALAPTSWSVGTLPLGGGRVQTAHGSMPIPAPATANLLQGFAMIDDGIKGERVTPTGAAILRYFKRKLGEPLAPGTKQISLSASGTGFGTREMPGISNVLRILLFDGIAEIRCDDRVGVISFEIDDQTAEDLAQGIDALRVLDGVLDVIQLPAVGKKGRMVFQVQLLCAESALNDVIDACFIQTTTIGLRWTISNRATLDRCNVQVGSAEDLVTVKLVNRPDGTVSAKAQADGASLTEGHANRFERRQTAQRLALRKLDSD